MNTIPVEGRNTLAIPFVTKPAGAVLADDKKFTARLPVVKKLPPKIRGHVVAVLGEGVGTFLFLFLAFAATLNANSTNDQVVSKNLYISLGFGFSLAVNAWTFFRVSGGLFNPAVTWGMALIGAITWFRAVLLFVTQLIAAIVAAAMARALYPADLNVQTTLDSGTTLVQGFFIEVFLTLQLVLTIFLLAAEKHRATFIAPVGIGLALFLAELAGVRYTGGSLNPARSLGPAVVNHDFHTYHWIYWIGPLLGATIAAVIYKLIKMLEYETANAAADRDDGHDHMVIERKSTDMQRQISPDARMSQDTYTTTNAANTTSHQDASRYNAGSDLENGTAVNSARA